MRDTLAAATKKDLSSPCSQDPLHKNRRENPSQKCSGQGNLMAEIVPRAACGVKRKGYKILW
jgi:hypothetical protein